MEAKEFFTTWECLNHKKSSQQLPSCVIATRDSLFSKMFSPCFEQEKTLKNSSRKLYAIKMTKKEEAETKSSVWEKLPKLAQILEQSSGTRQVCVSVFFFFSDHCIKQIDSMLSWVCSVIDHKRRQKWGKNISDTLACGSCATSLFLRHFDVICDLLLNRCTATWNPFGKHLIDSIKCKSPSPSPGARESMVHTVQFLRHDAYCPITLFSGPIHDYIHLDDGLLMMLINSRV